MLFNKIVPIVRLTAGAIAIGLATLVSISTFLPSKIEQIPSIEKAEYFYWVALADAGNISLLDKGLRIIDALLDSGLDDPEVFAIKSDLEEQLDMGHDTFGGVFPLARFALNPQIDLGAPFGIYETIDDVEVVAATRATASLIDHIGQNYKGTTGFDVLFVPTPELGDALVNEALYLFNQNPRFFVHNRIDQQRFQDEALSPELTELFLNGEVNSEIVGLAQQFFDANSLVVFDLTRQDSASNASFYVAKASVYRNRADIADSTIRNMGFAIDRTGTFSTIVFVLIAGLLLIVSFRFSEIRATKSLLQVVGLSVLMSVVAWLAAPTFLHASRQFLPVFSLETLAFSSFPIAAVIALVWGVGLVFVLYSGWEKIAPLIYSQSGSLNNKIALQSLSLGSSIWLVTVGLVYDPSALSILASYVIAKGFIVTTVVSMPTRSARQALKALAIPSIIIDFALLNFSDVSLVVFAIVAGSVAYWRVGVSSQSVTETIQRLPNEPDGLVPSSETIEQYFDLVSHAESFDRGIQITVLESADEDYAEFVASLLTKTCASRGTFTNSELVECGMSEWAFVEILAGERLDSDSNHQSEEGIVSDFMGSLPFATVLALGQSAPDLDRKNILRDALGKFKNRIRSNSAVFAVLHTSQFGTPSVEFLKLMKDSASEMNGARIVFYLFFNHSDLATEADFKQLADQFRKVEQPNRELSMLYLQRCFPDISRDQLEMIVDTLISEDGVCDPRDIRSLSQRMEILRPEFDNFHDLLMRAFAETDDDLVALVREVCLDRSHRELILASSLLMRYCGKISVSALSKILARDERLIFAATDAINKHHPVFYDPKSREIVLRFRSKELEKAISVALELEGTVLQKESFHQLLTARCLSVIVSEDMLGSSDFDAVLGDLSLIPCNDASDLLRPLVAFVATKYIEIKKMLFKGASRLGDEREPNKEYFAQVNRLMVTIDDFLQNNQLDHGEISSLAPDYIFLQSMVHLEQIHLKEDDVSSVGSHLQEMMTLLGMYPLSRFVSDQFLIYFVHSLSHMIQGLRSRGLPLSEIDILRSDFKARIKEVLTDQLTLVRPNWVQVRLEHILAIEDRGSHSIAEQSGVVKTCRKLLQLVPAWSRDASELLVRSLILRDISNMDSTANDAVAIADEAVDILRKFSDFENIPATYGAAARTQYFPAVKAEKCGDVELATASYKRFLDRLPQWLASSEEYPSPDQSFNAKNALMARTFEARAYGFLGRVKEISVADLSGHIVRLKGIADSWVEMGHGREENLGSLLSELAGMTVIAGVLPDSFNPNHLVAQIDELLSNAPAYVGDRWKQHLRQDFVEKFSICDG